MIQPAGHHLAEFNFGTLRYDWDEPRLGDFVAGLDLVNGIAAAAPGFVWRMDDAAMGAAQAATGNPRLASTLSVWQDVASLEHFVWATLHRQFYGRKAEWYDGAGNGNLVLWWVPIGHRPGFAEGMARWTLLQAQGDGDRAFGLTYLTEARLWRERACAPVAGR